MRITRFRGAAGGPAAYGLVEGAADELVVVPLEGLPYDGVRQVGALTRDELVLLVPVEPSKARRRTCCSTWRTASPSSARR